MRKAFIYILAIILFVLPACNSAPSTPQSIKFAVLPVLDVLPIYVAESQGYFKANNLNVEIIPVGSAPERDQLMQAGQIEGMLNETVTTLFYNRAETKIVIVRFARTATSEYPLFRILAAKGSGISSVSDLKEIPIGISEGTIIEYMTDKVLIKAGLDQTEIAKIAVPKIADRIALLNSGELKAANLPDPVASLAIQNGAKLIIDDTTYPDVSNSVYTFSSKAVSDKPEAVRSFLKAVEQAVNDINSDKTKWGNLLKEENLVPEPLLKTYVLPTFPTASVPTEAQFNDAVSWAVEKGLLEIEVIYQNSVNASFLPNK